MTTTTTTGTTTTRTTTTRTTTTGTAEQAAFRSEVRAFLEANAEPRRERSPWALGHHTDEASARASFERGRQWQRTMFDHGLGGLNYPQDLGGRGGEAWHQRIFDEEVVEFDVSPGFISSTIAMLGPTLIQFGSDEQKAEFVPKLLSGDYAFCQLFSEPGAGSDLAGLGCRAIRDGDEFIVTGQKVWNSAAQFANWGFLLVRSNPDAPKHKGITFILVDMSSPGIEVRPLVQPNGASEFNEVFFSEVRIPIDQVLGGIDGGWAVARTVMSNESAFIGGGGSSIGAYGLLSLLAARFGVEHDAVIRQGLAQAYIDEHVLGLLGQRIMGSIRRREAPPVDPSILKLSIAVNKVHTGNLAMEIAGAAAMTSDDEVSRWVQNELLSRFMVSIGGGTNEVQRNNLAERALGLPREPRDDHLLSWKDVPRS